VIEDVKKNGLSTFPLSLLPPTNSFTHHSSLIANHRKRFVCDEFDPRNGSLNQGNFHEGVRHQMNRLFSLLIHLSNCFGGAPARDQIFVKYIIFGTYLSRDEHSHQSV
jgi:hypothetical protein